MDTLLLIGNNDSPRTYLIPNEKDRLPVLWTLGCIGPLTWAFRARCSAAVYRAGCSGGGAWRGRGLLSRPSLCAATVVARSASRRHRGPKDRPADWNRRTYQSD